MIVSSLRIAIFRFAMLLLAIMAMVPLGLMHVFFPDAYFGFIKYEAWNPNDPAQREMVALIGSFFVALSYGAWRVRTDILRNRDLFVVLLLALVMTGAVVAYTILIGVAPPVVWLNTVIPYTVLVTILAFCYPWRDAKMFEPS